MKDKIIKAIQSFYSTRFDEYQMSPEEIADLVCKVVSENLPAEREDNSNGGCSIQCWNSCLAEIRKKLEG